MGYIVYDFFQTERHFNISALNSTLPFFRYETSISNNFQIYFVKAYLMYTAGKTKIGRKYNKIVYKDSNTTIPGVTEGLTGCRIKKQ